MFIFKEEEFKFNVSSAFFTLLIFSVTSLILKSSNSFFSGEDNNFPSEIKKIKIINKIFFLIFSSSPE